LKTKQHTAEYRLEDGNWLVEIAEIPQVHTFGRTLPIAREHIRDALALWLRSSDANSLDLRDHLSTMD
jgi:predicted RNase H-like HicB family nuclease